MAKQKQPRSISKKIRFEVFKRDSFTCQFCGAKSPDVLLQIDHIQPVSLGGGGDILNLITSCPDCNSGKSNRKLSDDSVVDLQRKQLKVLQERREQMEMMFKWQIGLIDINNESVNKLADYWSDLTGWQLTESGCKILRKLTRKFSIAEILHSMSVVVDEYIKMDEAGMSTQKSTEIALGKIGGVCFLTKNGDSDQQLYYIRGILRNRIKNFDMNIGLVILRGAITSGVTYETLSEIAKSTQGWTNWKSEINDAIDRVAKNGK